MTFTEARAQIMKAIDEYDEGRLTRASLEQVVTVTLTEIAGPYANNGEIIDDEQFEVEIIDDTPLEDLDDDEYPDPTEDDFGDWRSDT